MTSTAGTSTARRGTAARRARASRAEATASRGHASRVEGTAAVGGVGPRLAENARWLWGVCYRMTGSSADADDLVQETFVRAIERPPSRMDEPIGPWLLRVAVNLGRDALRRRKRRRYVGTWLPAVIEAEEIAPLEIEGEGGTEGRYDLLESVSFAFLLALEVLTPNQRAVLVLRDVLDRSVRETASMLGLSEGNVKVLHHRARLALEPYEAGREQTRPSAEAAKSSGDALQVFLGALAAGDEAALLRVLASGAEAWSDGGGEYLAAKVVVSGAERVARMFLGLAKKSGAVVRYALRALNGMPAFVAERAAHAAHVAHAAHASSKGGRARGAKAHGEAPRMVMACDVDGEGRIVRVYTVLASEKLAHVRAVGA
jgi:RNA polymerase sigma-70 factor (ECF subfamily)